MLDHQRAFLRFSRAQDALRFGEFTLKSGRKSPYFFNAGLFNSGASLAALGRYYAEAIVHAGVELDVLYGPAYKGIPLAAATSIALADHHGMDIPYAFNRKEAKDHGEGGDIVGSPLHGRCLIIDDVITAGTSVRESVDIIRGHGATPCGVVIALDRQERGRGDKSAIQEVQQSFGMPVYSIVTLSHVIELVAEEPDAQAYSAAIESYRGRYGIQS